MVWGGHRPAGPLRLISTSGQVFLPLHCYPNKKYVFPEIHLQHITLKYYIKCFQQGIMIFCSLSSSTEIYNSTLEIVDLSPGFHLDIFIRKCVYLAENYASFQREK
jgi:hypothetical protein